MYSPKICWCFCRLQSILNTMSTKSNNSFHLLLYEAVCSLTTVTLKSTRLQKSGRKLFSKKTSSIQVKFCPSLFSLSMHRLIVVAVAACAVVVEARPGFLGCNSLDSKWKVGNSSEYSRSRSCSIIIHSHVFAE